MQRRDLKTHAAAWTLALSLTISGASAAGAQAVGPRESPEALSADSPGDIVVTARKRDERLIDVPVAVTSVSAKELERTSAVSLTKIATLAPQLLIVRADSGAGAAFSLRGVGSPAYDSGIEQSVSVDIDGVQIGRGAIIAQSFLDLQSVQVLKGPQALYFGKNASAGVTSLRSNDPTSTFEGYIRAGYEFKANERYVEGAISGPISDTLKARLAVRASKMRGWTDNFAPGGPSLFSPGFISPPGPKSNGDRNVVVRLTLKYQPSDRFDATLKVMGAKYKDNGSTSTTTPYCFLQSPRRRRSACRIPTRRASLR